MTTLHAALRPILIAEDDEPIAALLTTVVADLGFQPLLAADGQRALDLAQASWPVLVLTDLMMPRLGGAALIAALRAAATASGRAAPPVILLTAADRQHTQDVGADAVLPKPFDLSALERLIARLLEDTGSQQGQVARPAPAGPRGCEP